MLKAQCSMLTIENLSLRIFSNFQIFKLGFLVFIIHCSSFVSFAQHVSVIAKFDSSNVIKIGDQLKLHLKAQISKSSSIQWPTIQDTIVKQIEVVDKTSIDTVPTPDGKQMVLSQTLLITSFDSGYWALPPFKFFSINGEDTIVYETSPLLLQVNTVSVDTTQAIKAIKEPLAIPFDWIELAGKILIFLLVSAIILCLVWIVWRNRNRKAEVVEIKEEIIIAAHEIALQKLEELKEKKLWQNNQVKEYHALLSEIVRAYLENRFQFNALEFTTDEIMRAIRNIEISTEAVSKLRQLLILSDFVKYAKEQPLANENELSMNNAIEFIHATKEKNEAMNE